VVRERHTFLELQEEKNRLRDIAYTDTLTGLQNRAYLKKIYEQWSTNEDHNFFALMLDMDNLKQINDQVGHDAGDFAIHSVAQCLQEHMTDKDVVIRLGGDEFVGLISVKTEDETRQRVEHLLTQLNLIKNPGNIVIKASIGVAHIGNPLSLSSLLKRCDALMYAAKESGKNTAEYEF
jgi:diguanylate cyclase (GGDEF)-like protein